MNLENIFSFEHLYLTHINCRKSKQHKGEVIRFEINLSTNLVNIHQAMILKKYKFGKYKQFKIYESKERFIEAPTYKDRVVIRCFCDYCLKPKLEPKLIFDNAACRENKGTSFAINRLEHFLKKEFLKTKNNQFYYLKCDIRKYFPSISHEILIHELNKVSFSSDEMWFIKKLLEENPSSYNKGLPLGNQSSQWFALFYLNPLDRFIKEKLKIKSYIRYMDDMILIHHDKTYLQKCLKDIYVFCNEKLDLSLNHKTQIGKVENGIDFLGYRHILNKKGKIIRKLRSSSRIRLKKHLKTLNQLEQKGLVGEEYVTMRKKAFWNHIKNTSESRFLKSRVK